MIHSRLFLAGTALYLGASMAPTGDAGTTAPADIALVGQVIICEVGVDLDTGFPADIEGDFIQLCEINGEFVDLGPYRLVGCDDMEFFRITDFSLGASIPASGSVLVADNAYDAGDGPDRDFGFNLGADLVASDGGVALVRKVDGVVVDWVKWGNPPLPCDSYDPAGVLPNSDESMNRTDTGWELAIPTPGS